MRRKIQVGSISEKAGRNIDRNVVNRLDRLLNVRRFLLSWILLVVMLSGVVMAQTYELGNFYQKSSGVPGGIYSEGILGDFTTANPIYAAGPVDDTLSKLVFSSLLTYNSNNQLVGDLASGWSVNSTGKIYTVTLRPNLTWQDGKPLTAADVVFTYKTIQDPDSQSDLNSSWQDVVVKEVNPTTVTFTLSNPLDSFPYSLTNGIIPQHILGNVAPSELRSSKFNTQPIGSGPFDWKSLEVAGDTPSTREEQIILTPFAGYHEGKAKLSEFIVRAFHDQNNLINHYLNGSLTAISGLNYIPSSLNRSNLYTYSFPLTAAEMVFFKTDAGVLADQNVRRALVEGADVNSIINGLGYAVIPVREPLLIGQLGYDPTYSQSGYNPTAAEAQLIQDGWVMGKNGVRYKNGVPLEFNLYAADTRDSRYVTTQLSQEWKTLGVNVQVIVQSDADLQDTVSLHNYDALLYGISIGVDPDVFVYWDSSQANPQSPNRLNFSEYKSSTADMALEGGRTRSDPALRAVKYQPFLQAWQQDAPALGLYQPRYLYVSRVNIYGLSEHKINTLTDIYNNVQNWEMLTGKIAD